MFCGIWLIIRRCQESFKVLGRLNFRRPLFFPSGFARRVFLCPLFGGLDMGGKKSGGAATPSYEEPNTLNSAQSLRITGLHDGRLLLCRCGFVSNDALGIGRGRSQNKGRAEE